MAMGGDRKQQRHRIRVATVVIDATDLEQAAAFWSAALDRPVLTGDPAQDRYVSLGQAAGGLRLLLQRVPERGRDKNTVHLDLETDDPAAEVARLTSLGASPERPLGHGAWVLQDPAGNRFCVIYPETPDWPQGTMVVADPTPTGP
jgi:catechol 2,3-dioxygenase-like lactoylglutathione lyase family enzyme